MSLLSAIMAQSGRLSQMATAIVRRNSIQRQIESHRNRHSCEIWKRLVCTTLPGKGRRLTLMRIELLRCFTGNKTPALTLLIAG